MEYEIYQTTLDKENYFARWTAEDLVSVGDKKDHVYNKYLVKCQIFQRDGFACQNELCESPNSPLTWHHIKKRKNGGRDDPRNGVTICDACHKKFHRGKLPLVLPNSEHLPAHIRGHTFKEYVEEAIDWKKIKSGNRKLRKEIKHTDQELRLRSFGQIYVLLFWLYGSV